MGTCSYVLTGTEKVSLLSSRNVSYDRASVLHLGARVTALDARCHEIDLALSSLIKRSWIP